MRALFLVPAFFLVVSMPTGAEDELGGAAESPTVETGNGLAPEMKPVTTLAESIEEWRRRVCAVDREGYGQVQVDCPFSDKMKFRFDGPYVLKRLPKRISELLRTQLSAALSSCADPIDAFYGVTLRYRSTAAWYGTRRGILVFVKEVHQSRMTDYMNPKINWPDWPADVPVCEKR